MLINARLRFERSVGAGCHQPHAECRCALIRRWDSGAMFAGSVTFLAGLASWSLPFLLDLDYPPF